MFSCYTCGRLVAIHVSSVAIHVGVQCYSCGCSVAIHVGVQLLNVTGSEKRSQLHKYNY